MVVAASSLAMQLEQPVILLSQVEQRAPLASLKFPRAQVSQVLSMLLQAVHEVMKRSQVTQALALRKVSV